MTRAPSIALVGLGEVGTSFADALLDRGIELKVASRESSRSTASAKKIGIELDHDIARAAGTADIVLLTMTGDGLREVVAKIAPVLREHAILANLTAANPPHVIAAGDMLGANRPQFVDVAIMGAVSLHGIRTPLLASGEMATDFAAVMNPLGFSVSAREGSAVGDASSLKLLRSLFAKGLDALVVESMLAAEALGGQDLIELLSDLISGRCEIISICTCGRISTPAAGVEMELAEEQMKSLGLRRRHARPSIVTATRRISPA
jgi:3-hydroxyisobutyrate dehydrogenase-like beta-hydroxyacid dehydrogenase